MAPCPGVHDSVRSLLAPMKGYECLEETNEGIPAANKDPKGFGLEMALNGAAVE